MKALWDYKAEDSDELSFKEGELIDLVTVHEGWLLIKIVCTSVTHSLSQMTADGGRAGLEEGRVSSLPTMWKRSDPSALSSRKSPGGLVSVML